MPDGSASARPTITSMIELARRLAATVRTMPMVRSGRVAALLANSR